MIYRFGLNGGCLLLIKTKPRSYPSRCAENRFHGFVHSATYAIVDGGDDGGERGRGRAGVIRSRGWRASDNGAADINTRPQGGSRRITDGYVLLTFRVERHCPRTIRIYGIKRKRQLRRGTWLIRRE